MRTIEYGSNGYMSPAANRHVETIEIFGEVYKATPMAYYFHDGNKSDWVPRSQVEWDESEGLMTMPTWLAIEKGFC